MVKKDIHVKLVGNFLRDQTIFRHMKSSTQEKNLLNANFVTRKSGQNVHYKFMKEFTLEKGHINVKLVLKC